MLAAARFWSWRRTDLLCLPALGRQLPFSPAALPRTGSNPGQQCCDEAGFFALLLLDCRVLVLWERAADVIERSDAIEHHERSAACSIDTRQFARPKKARARISPGFNGTHGALLKSRQRS